MFNDTRYTYASAFAIQIVGAASFTDYWGLAQVYQTVLLYFIAPFSILFINFAGVLVRYLTQSSTAFRSVIANLSSTMGGLRLPGEFSKSAWWSEEVSLCMLYMVRVRTLYQYL